MNDLINQLKKKEFWVTAGKYLVGALIPVLLFYLMELYEHNPFLEVRSQARVLNIFLFELIAWLLFFVTGGLRSALRIEAACAMIFGLVNHYVMAFRSTPFVPWDFLSIRTAASVVGEYNFAPTGRVVWVTLGFVAIIGLLQFLKLKEPFRLLARIICATVLFGSLWIFVGALQDDDFQNKNYLYPFLFTPVYMTKVNGMAVTFAMNLEYIVIDKPTGYSVEKAQAILEEYQEEEVPEDDLPNIIVIMNEAFSDMKVVGDFETSEDYMPFVHQLMDGADNTISGWADVSVCGGNTANSEFEFLTGNSMAFLPMGSIPYQQYLKGECPSIASHLKQYGYLTYGQHPYNSTGWARNVVYPRLGIDQTLFLKDYSVRKYIRDYQSDWADFQQIITTYEEHDKSQPMFLFNVTMQNHGGYTEKHENFTPEITTPGIGGTVLSTYLSLLKETDECLVELISYFEEVDEKTMIVFFGDHQPNSAVANPIFRYNGIDPNALTEEQRLSRYKVPYFIWANFDIPESTQENLSLNYLGAKVLETAGVPQNAYMKFLQKLQEEYESITAMQMTEHSDGHKERREELLKEYQILQYYFMFDWNE